MKKRNSSAKKKIHNFFKNSLKNLRIKKIYSEFKNNIGNYNLDKLSVAISGGPDSIALAFLTKCYSIEKKVKIFYYIVDHKLRKHSTIEANLTKRKLKKYDINCKILTWKEKKNYSNIQSKAREKRYELIFKESIKNKINIVLTAHQKDDLFENFFIRLLRGSGLKGLSSFSKIKTKNTKINSVEVIRPLLNISKKDLSYITKNTFNFYVSDPSNNNNYFLRVKIRKLLANLEKEGLTLNKFKLTLDNLNKSSSAIDFYVDENIKKNSKILNNKKCIIVNFKFFNQPDEIIFRSLTILLHKIGNKKNYTRGKKVLNLIESIKLSKNFHKTTLSGCIIEKVNKTFLISKES